VISDRGDLPLDRAFFTARDFDAVVYLSDRVDPKRRAAVEATGRPAVLLPAGDEIAAMLRHMRHELAASLLLLEGGPGLNGQFLEGGHIDEVFVTIGPVVVGGANPTTLVSQSRPPSLDATQPLALLSAHPNPETGEVYLRYRVGGRDSG
jgi:riboflavin biosynthesis pyrimidine reductase